MCIIRPSPSHLSLLSQLSEIKGFFTRFSFFSKYNLGVKGIFLATSAWLSSHPALSCWSCSCQESKQGASDHIQLTKIYSNALSPLAWVSTTSGSWPNMAKFSCREKFSLITHKNDGGRNCRFLVYLEKLSQIHLRSVIKGNSHLLACLLISLFPFRA